MICEIDITEEAEAIASDLKCDESISIDDIAWASLDAVDDIKCLIADEVHNILTKQNIKIEE